MFDCIPNPIKIRKARVATIEHIKIIFHCYKCGKMIHTWWDNESTLDWNGFSHASDWSEVFNEWQTDPNKVICFECLNIKI